jgi:hypothetical protein
MSYIILRGRWFHIIVPNVYVLTVDNTDDVKDGIYVKLEHIFDKFSKYLIKILLGDFSAKGGKDNIWNTRLRMQRGVGIAGSGVGL